MKSSIFLLSFVVLFATSCKKNIGENNLSEVASKLEVANVKNPFIEYNILKGQQYSDKSAFIKAEYDELKFIVKFDSSAIYKTTDADNQSDINKLYGFSDNNAQHHQFSARIGWCWSVNNQLCLFAYVYNNGVRSSKLISAISIGTEHLCSIKATAGTYVFTVNGKTEIMDRASTTAKATGYKLFPYFGGDEVAPHNIKIWIREL